MSSQTPNQHWLNLVLNSATFKMISMPVMHISLGLESQTSQNPQRLIVPTHIRTLAPLKYSSGGFVSHGFYDATDKPIIFPTNSSLRSAQNADKLTSAFGLKGHHALAEVSGHDTYAPQSKLIMLCRLYS